MKINFSQLKKLSVVTQNGINLGKVIDLELTIESLGINKLTVSEGLLGKKFLVDQTQVIEITAEKIIVADELVQETLEEKKEEQIEQAPAPAIEKSLE